jgi:hypothetical protein
MSVRVIARRPDPIVGLGETRIHAETATCEVRASEGVNPRPNDQLQVGGEIFVPGELEPRDPDRLVWTLDVRPLCAEPMALPAAVHPVQMRQNVEDPAKGIAHVKTPNAPGLIDNVISDLKLSRLCALINLVDIVDLD